jgi:hypothetical protein
MKENDSAMSDILEFFSKKCSKVETIIGQTPVYQFFPILPFCEFESNQTKQIFLKNVDRLNAKTKCEGLIKESPFMIIELKTHYWLRTKLSRFMSLFIKYLELWRNIFSLFIVIINFIILFSYDDKNSNRRKDPQLFEGSEKGTLAFLVIIGI